MLKLHKLGDTRYRQFTLLLYGEAGRGKTSCVRTLAPLLSKLPDGSPDWSKLLLIPGDPGHKSISDLTSISMCIPFTDMTPIKIVEELERNVNPTTSTRQFDAIVVDGLDNILQEAWNQINELDQKSAKPNMMAVWGDYGKMMWSFLDRLTKPRIGCPVIVITHPKEVDAEAVGPDEARVNVRTIGGNAITPDSVMGMFDYVFYMKMARLDPSKPPTRVFVTQRDPAKPDTLKYATKSRVPIDRPQLPSVMPADLMLVHEKLFPTQPVK